ncbi:MAG TPA: helix-turn-helix domain-containing protein [Acidimicrobiales bacterium]
MPPTAPRRPRGRPPKSEGLVTAQSLLEAATEVCAERGFDGTTLARIAERAGVSPSAVYNHYASREDLLYAAAVRGLERITTLSTKAAGRMDVARALAAAYLRPELRSTRRLLVELHAASGRDERIAELLARWHRSWEAVIVEQLPPDDPSPRATVKALFLVLLGLCHLEDVPAVRAPRADVVERAERAVAAIVGAGAGRTPGRTAGRP